MNDFIIVTEMPCPDVRGVEHGRRKVVARTFVDCYLAIILSGRRTQGIGPEVCRVPRQGVTILVINNAGIVRSAGAIRPAGPLHQRSVLKQISAWAEMNFSVRRN